MKIVFAGTPEFALPAMQVLVEAGHTIQRVYTQPDRPAGRGRKLTASPIKQYALQKGLPVFQPTRLKKEVAALKEIQMDAMVVVAYGLLLPPDILQLPRLGCLNIHPSLLPRWRGAAPIQRAIEAGDTTTGVCVMRMDEGLDTGPVLQRHAAPIHNDDTAQTLHDRLAMLGAKTLIATLESYEKAEAVNAEAVNAEAQSEVGACYAKRLEKTEAKLDWSLPAHSLHCKIRAFNPWPVATAGWRSQPVRLWGVGDWSANQTNAAPGEIIELGPKGICVATGQGSLYITRLQLPGSKPISHADFVNGQAPKPNDRFD